MWSAVVRHGYWPSMALMGIVFVAVVSNEIATVRSVKAQHPHVSVGAIVWHCPADRWGRMVIFNDKTDNRMRRSSVCYDPDTNAWLMQQPDP